MKIRFLASHCRARWLWPAAQSSRSASRRRSPPPMPLQIAQAHVQSGKLQKPADLDELGLPRHVARHGLQPGLVQCRAPGAIPGRADGAERVSALREERQLCAGLDVPAVVLQQRSAEALDQPERLHAGGSHELRDPPDRPDARQGRPRVLSCSARTTREGDPLPAGNDCVRCHVEHGAFEGTFAQFYPTLRPLIPKEALERAARDHDIR